MTNQTQAPALTGNWHYPTSIRFGAGRIAEINQCLDQLGIRKPLVVTDKGLADLPFVSDLLANLTDARLFYDVKTNPTGRNIDAGVLAYHQGHHDGVIALGGGSGLDAGKAIALMVGQQRPLWDFEDVGDNWTRVDSAAMAPLIAIPTTAGTGSEVGRAAVIVDEQSHSKKIIFHPNMLPKLVICDPQLTLGLPAHITAATGIDALVHNLEAYLAPFYHPMADGIAVQAMRLIKQWLPEAVANGNNITARSHMMVASTMGATAFQKGLGGVHALAHPLGAIYDKHHGLLNAILLPYVLLHNRQAIDSQITSLAQQLNISDPSFNHFMDWILALRQQLAIPNSLAEIGIDTSQQQFIGEQALADPSAAGNPLPLTSQDYSAIFINAVNGTL